MTHNPQGQQEDGRFKEITGDEVRQALRNIGRRKAEGPDDIPIEVWSCLEDKGIHRSTGPLQCYPQDY